MKAIIFGASGQDGFYLTKLLIKNLIRVIGVSRTGDYLRTDLSNFNDVSNLIKKEIPDYIFHLAANSTTKHEAIFENHETISTGTLNILEAVKQFAPLTKVFISGTGLQFFNDGFPIKETNSFAANNAYAISRIQSVYAARYYRDLGLKIYVGYFFNHDSPFRTERHVTKKISETIKRISIDKWERLEIGDAFVVKEWSFAGDIVEGIWLLINQDNIFEANISSGEGHSINEWIAECFKIVKIAPLNYVTKLEGFTSPYGRLVSDNSLIKSIGYKPMVSFKGLAQIMMNE